MKKFISIVLTLILSFTIIGCSKNSDQVNKSENESKLKVGQAFEDKGLNVLIESYEDLYISDDELRDTSVEYKQIKVKVENISEDKCWFKISDFALRTSYGEIQPNVSSLRDIKILQNKELNPGESVEGNILYEIKKGEDIKEIVYSNRLEIKI